MRMQWNNHSFSKRMRVCCGSLSAGHRNYLGVRCVPKAASHDLIFGVRFGEVSHRTLGGVRY